MLPRKHIEAGPLTRYSVRHKFYMLLKRQRLEGGGRVAKDMVRQLVTENF